MDAALIDASVSPTQPLPAEALSRLQDLLPDERSVQTDQTEGQGRAVAEKRHRPHHTPGRAGRP